MGLYQNTNQPDSALEQAVDWYVLISSDEASPEEKAAFQHWLSEPAHAETYAKLEKVWDQFSGLSESTERYALNQSLVEKPALAAGKPAQLLLLAGVCASIWFGYQSTPGQMLRANHLAITEQQTLRLDDQSVLHLAPMTAVNIDYSSKARSIELLRGALQVEVARDKTRPLIVRTETGTAEALGTVFSVTQQDPHMQVKVTESRVRVCPLYTGPDLSTCVTASAGDQVQVTKDQALRQPKTEGRLDINWQRQLLIVEKRPLLEVLDILQDYNLGYLNMDRDSLAALQVSGVFPLRDLRQSLDIMAASLSLEVKQYTPALTVVRRK